jgi:hypothetical protein
LNLSSCPSLAAAAPAFRLAETRSASNYGRLHLPDPVRDPLLQLHRPTMRFARQSVSKPVRGDLPTPPSALRALFPDVAELTIELQFTHELGWSPSNQLRILRPAARASFRYPCPFPGCSGWFDIDAPTQALLQSHEKSLVSELYCTGVRPRDRTMGKPCKVHVKYRIAATYGNSKA